MDLTKRLSLLTYTTKETALAAGIAPAKLQQRIKENRLPDLARPGVGSGNRRGFGLLDIYVLRLMEALTGGLGVPLADAMAIIDDIRGVNVVNEQNRLPPLSGVNPLGPLEADLSGRNYYPPFWPAEWQNRDITKPIFLIATHVLSHSQTGGPGWATVWARDHVALYDALNALPHPPRESLLRMSLDDGTPRPVAALVVNVTRELVAVDNALAIIRPQEFGSADDDSDDE
jgi:hypothetical protein